MSQTLPNQAPVEPGQNFQLLRDEGQAIIARLAGSNWSDHNLHDPGITLLEAASFAITDLSYRLDFPITDLMAQPEDEKPLQPWWQPEQALACAPVTANDLRRLLLDCAQVHNVDVRLDPDNPALWQVRVVATDSVQSAEARAALAERLRQHYMANRNLGEDLGSLSILEPRALALKMSLTLADGADTAETLADMLVRLADIITPGVTFQSCEQMQARGYSNGDLCSGPWLERGFISDDQLQRPIIKTELFLSDLISEVDQDERVEAISQLQASLDDEWQSWRIMLGSADENIATVLDLDASLDNLSVVKEGIPVQIPAARIRQRYQQQRQQQNAPGRPSMLGSTGRYRNPGQYLSLQHELPASYGVGRDGIAASAPPEEVAAIQQLQGWLMLLDQPLANLCAQLDNARHLLSLPDGEALAPLLDLLERMLASLPLSDSDISLFWQAVAHLPRSHCSQPIEGLHSLNMILGDRLDDYLGRPLQQLTEPAFSERQLERGDRVLQHLLARHHEQVPDRAMLRYEELFQHYSADLLNHPQAREDMDADQLTVALASLKNLLDRAAFVLDLPITGGQRGLGGNYLAQPVRTDDAVCGLRHRIYRRLGLGRVRMNSLATHNGEGFHLVEGVLLRHGNSAAAARPDEIFLVLPNWPSRFADPDFAQLFVDTLHGEMPMHLTPTLIWLDYRQMGQFEQLHNGWLNALSVSQQPDNGISCNARAERLTALSDMLADFLVNAASGNPPELDYNSIRLPTLAEHSSTPDSPETIPVECFTVGYTPVPALTHDPNNDADGTIGSVSINPSDDADKPFIVRIRDPFTTRD